MDTDSIDSGIETALTEGYSAIFGHPMTEGLLSWLFGSKKTPAQQLSEKVNDIFEKFYEREGVRRQRLDDRMSTGYSPALYQGIDRATMDRIDGMRQAILREVTRCGKAFDRAVKDREKAYKTRDSYSDKLDYMRDSRDDYRKRYQEQRRKK